MSSKERKKLIIPHTLTIIFLLIVFVAILTWIIPSGEFLRQEIDQRLVVIPNTYKAVSSNPQGILEIFKAPIDGFIDAAEVVGFVLLVGGSFGVVNKTKAIESAISEVIKKLNGKELILIPISMLIFGLGGTTFGMSEETLPFYMIFVPLMISLGYDSLTAIGTVFIGAITGTIASTINPFSVGIGQALAQITPGLGIGFRSVVFIIYIIVAIIYVMNHAIKVKKDPKKSIVYEIDQEHKEDMIHEVNIKEFTIREVGVLTVFFIGMSIMVYGVLVLGWYIPEIAMSFTAIGILSGLVSGLNQVEIAEAFIEGARDLMSAGLAIALARGIVIVAQNGFIIDTILNYAADFLGSLPKIIFGYLTFILEFGLAFLIPSSSGLASLTIPVLAPLSELVNVSSQVIVLAYQFGVGIANLMTPTSGILMGALAVSRIPFSKWLRFVLPMVSIFIILSMIVITIAIAINF